MTPTTELIESLRLSLKAAQKKDKLSVLAAVAGISEKRLKEIIKGAEPTHFEFMTLDTLRGM